LFPASSGCSSPSRPTTAGWSSRCASSRPTCTPNPTTTPWSSWSAGSTGAWSRPCSTPDRCDRTTSPALYISVDPDDEAHIQQKWDRFGFDIPLEIVDSPYRELTPAVEKYLVELDARWRDDTITVVIPEFVAGRLLSPSQLLHNQSAGALKLTLLYRRNTVVTSVSYHVDPPSKAES